MTTTFNPRPAPPSALVTWTQNTAIFAVCVNLFSTALANLGFALFLLLFLAICLSGQRRHLDTRNFPLAVAAAVGIYIGWQIVGLSYTEAPKAYAWQSVFSDRKIIYILPLALVFTDESPKRRFLVAFFIICVVGLLVSFALKAPFMRELIGAAASLKKVGSGAPLVAENVFRSHATQSMVFALCTFLALWFARQQKAWLWRAGLFVLALAFAANVALVTPGRSGYVVFLVLVVWWFAVWRGVKGVLLGALAALVIGLLAYNLSPTVHNRVKMGMTEARNFSEVPEETSLGRRMLMVQTSLGMIAERPLLGVGTGSFKQSFSAIAAEKYTGWRAIPFDDPHNQYLFVTVENGVIGLIAFLFMLAMIIKACLKSGTVYGKMAAGCMLAWCATSLFSGHFRTFPEGHLIAFIVGILMVSRVPDGQKTDGAA
ncbi:MAG: O-antigen ligase family protein [Polaromonas sp.]|uniref:O-antigen ligase family protein n=1 Tax=Polaromonas sp. TaxID=1869339 RepID=UPI0017ED48CF|nr:O-antigen ligase family protein [Polaromonas sp.]MBA3594202.1 O-antigen ligase family protein [Polaromonas sp.]